MKSILLPEFVFFRSRLRLSLKNTNSLFYCFVFILQGRCTSYYNIPSSLPKGAFFCPPQVCLFFRSRSAYGGTACYAEEIKAEGTCCFLCGKVQTFQSEPHKKARNYKNQYNNVKKLKKQADPRLSFCQKTAFSEAHFSAFCL